MVKKEKPVKEKSATNIHQDNAESWQVERSDSFCCSGKFQEDFGELVLRAKLPYTPVIVSRGRGTLANSTQTPDLKPEKSTKAEKSREKQSQQSAQLSQEVEMLRDDRTADRLRLTKPLIHVEMDHPDKHETVTEVRIRGWRVDEVMLDILRQCWQSLERLHTLEFWNTGLTVEALTKMALFLPQCASIRSLAIEGNSPTIKTDVWKEFIKEGCQLTSLSLRYDGIADAVAEALADSLHGVAGGNCKLVSLNLSGNSISDVGAVALAKALKMNRTLLTLSLAGNPVGDEGAKALAAALSRFALSHEETVHRRQLLWAHGLGPEQSSKALLSAGAHRRGESSAPRTSAGTSRAAAERKEKTPKKKAEKEEKPKQPSKGKESDRPAAGKKGLLQTISEEKIAIKSAGKGGRERRSPKGDRRTVGAEAEVDHDAKHPLLHQTQFINGELWIPGNLVLISLNLQRTEVGEEGVRALTDALRYQDALLHSAADRSNFGTGLLRLEISSRNRSPSLSDELRRLKNLMARRYPKTENSQ